MKNQRQISAMAELLLRYCGQVEEDIKRWLVEPGVPDELGAAMRYCVLGGGKRMRPALVLMAAEAVGDGPPDEMLRRCAVAVELVHCYSLAHDDLPAMDDDTMRRGQPTAHVRFGEAMAILAGDALLTRALGLVAEYDDPRSARLVGELARAAGAAGMIAGQVADMGLCRVADGLDGLRYIHLHKTAALIRAPARMGAICAGAGEEELRAISNFAELLGLAFQLVDDMLDVTSDTATLGKTAGKDAANDKRTHAGLIGLRQASETGRELTRQACLELTPLGDRARTLRDLADLLARRTH